MVTFFALFLIFISVWDAWREHPPKAEFRDRFLWWAWWCSSALVFVGALSVFSEHTFGFPPSRYAESFLIIGFSCRIIIWRTGGREIPK